MRPASPFALAAPAALAALLIPACSKESPKPSEAVEASLPPEPAPSASPSEASSAPVPLVPPTPMATLQLLDPGQPPRRRLRYVWRVDQREQLALDLGTSATVGGKSDIALPTAHIAIAVEPKSVSPEGDLQYAWRVTGTSVKADPAVSPEIADGMRQQVGLVEHMRGTAVETAQGLSKDLTVDPTSVDPGSQTQMVVQVVQTLRDVAAPLPAEEVGEGARWQKLARMDARDAHVVQTETFTLASMKGDTGTLADSLAQTASPQSVSPGGGPPARIESMLTSGEAKYRFALTRLVPQMAFEGTSQMLLAGQGAETPGRMALTVRVKIALDGTTAPGEPR